MREDQKLCGHDRIIENSRQKRVCLYCGLGIEEILESETERLRIFYPYRIEFNEDINIDLSNFDLKNIGTLKECKRIIDHYYPGSIIKDKVYPYDQNSQEIIYKDEVVGYIIGNVFRY